MDRLTAMQVFVEIADRGSLTAAAAQLEMSRAMVSRYLEGLESWLGLRLLHRTTRRVSLTDAGAEALERCRQALELAGEVQAVAATRGSEPSGRLRITTAPSFAQAHLAAAAADFLARHPRTQIELIAMDRAANLVEERIDIAVRIAARLDDGLVSRRLGDCRSLLCAAPAWLKRHGAPASPDELRQRPCLTHVRVGRTEYRLTRDGQTQRVPITGPLQCDDSAVLLQAVLAGAGIAMLPTYLVSALVVRGELVPVLPGWEPEVLGIHAIYLSRQHPPRLLRVMLDFLAERFGGGEAPWDRALRAIPVSRRRHVAR
ncbi:LysR family transcriptional regulator [Aquincola sp. S2]|uniref:LysR family transcriptional regulator n=1 Tax=Pseudaquabacterium terrae TaxID=2732868 RepID=A0ABX2EGN6_9BURK|nr:LysR family transcriptional regulator [Aquabacterium terrae]NRF67788.1 LysR family transcriptional regulator [Aquabacterium terrae]